MLNPAAYENSRPDGSAVLEVLAGDDAPRLFVPLRRTVLTGTVVGPLAALKLEQTFGYTAEQCAQSLEAVYRFPLPGDAAVAEVRVVFGSVEIATELKPRAEAEAEYAQAKEEGRQAVLTTRETPDVFTLRVAGIHPEEDVRVETRYTQLARAEGDGWSLRIPLTTAPRYVREDEDGSRQAQGQPLALLRDPGHRFALDLRFRGAETIGSSTHAVDVEEGTAGETGEPDLRARLHGGEAVPDRDCVLSWRPARERDRPALRAWVHAEPEEDAIYFLALVSPPADPGAAGGLPREVVVLVDRSGSMSGAKWEAADWAVNQFLGALSGQDRFTLGLFHDRTRWLWKEPAPAGERSIGEAIAFLERERESGGTELGVALEQALRLRRPKGFDSRHVLIITDAEVSDASRILRLAEEEQRRADRRRISILCIDAAPNSHLALELADRGGGTARFLTSSPLEEDITTALDEVLLDWNAPLLAGLRLEINRPEVDAGGRAVSAGGEASSRDIDLGDLPAGRSLWVVGRASALNGSDLRLRLAAARPLAMTRVPLVGVGSLPAVKALFGARRILALEYLQSMAVPDRERRETLCRLGYDLGGLERPAGSRPALYPENAGELSLPALRALLVRESLRYGLPCAETAFVAVRTEAGQRVAGTVPVANALPAGWSDDFLALGSPACSGCARRWPARLPSRRWTWRPRRRPARPADRRPRSRRGRRWSRAVRPYDAR